MTGVKQRTDSQTPPRRNRLERTRTRGFTLIEIAIVLLVIGLMLGTTLRGQELIISAQAKKLASEFKNIPVLIYGYQDKYRALPGDDQNPKSHLATTGLQPGNGNGKIDGNWYDEGPTSEASRTWQHLRLAGLADGPTDLMAPDYQPINALGKKIGLQSGTADPTLSPIINAAGQSLSGNYIICSRGIPGSLVRALDISLDDGDPASGSMLATLDTGSSYALGAAAATLATGSASALKAGEFYVVCLGS